MLSKKKVKIRVLILMLVFVYFAASCQFTRFYPPPSISHSINELSGLAEIWSLKNIYVDHYSSPNLVASDGKVIILGTTTNTSEQEMTCFDGQTGKVVWRKTKLGQDQFDLPPDVIYATPGGLYVGIGGIPYVKKYDLSTGNLIWSQSLSGRGMLSLYVYGDEVQINTGATIDIFTVLNATNGQVIRVVKGDIFIRTPEETFLPIGSYGLQANNTATGERLWEVLYDPRFYKAPIFTENTIYVRSGSLMGRVYAIQSSSGVILWETNNVVVSSIALSMRRQSIYALTINGELWRINIDSGHHTVIGQFSNLPFSLSGRDFLGAYDIAYDESTETLYIVLGDSLQLFALKEQ